MTKVSSSVSTTEYTSFDILGRVTGHKQTTNGQSYSTAYSYNLSGALVEQTYPSGRIVKNVIDNNGDLSMVQSGKCLDGTLATNATCTNNAGLWNYAKNFTYNSAGAVTSMQLGNHRWESTQFNSRLQPTQIALGSTNGATNLLKLDYDYGELNQSTGQVDPTKNNGNLAKQKITVPTVGLNSGFTAQQYYAYDSLNRLQIATENTENPGQTILPSWKQTFIYDRYGNRNFDEANTNFAGFEKLCNGNTELCASLRKKLNPEILASNNRIKGDQDGDKVNDYVFDAAGNTVRDPDSRKFTYDAENKQIKVETVDSGGTPIATIGEYSYDGDGKRVKKYVPSTGETTIFVYEASGKTVAEYSTTQSQTQQVSYTTADHLGSPRILTDQNGAVISRRDFHPFGEEIMGSGGRTQGLNYSAADVRKQFTGYERDNETDLDFAQARYYTKNHGRFTSVDPIIMEKRRLADPRAINLYLYTRNNPLKYIDPDGERFKGTDGEEVIVEREKVDGKKIWVIKSGNASDDLKKLVGLINNSGSRTASNMFRKLNKHETMINLVIDTKTSDGSTTIGLHQPHDKNGPIGFGNNSPDKFDSKAEPAVDNKGNIIEGAYKEATITLYEKRMEDLGYSGERLDGRLVATFGHEARHDLDPIQVQAGLTGTGSDQVWHPSKQGNPGGSRIPKKESPNYFGNKIIKQIEQSKGITIN